MMKGLAALSSFMHQVACMKLYLLTQFEVSGWDTYDSVVVAAPNEEVAQNIHPAGSSWPCRDNSWCSFPQHVKAEYLGEAADYICEGVICASYNAG